MQLKTLTEIKLVNEVVINEVMFCVSWPIYGTDASVINSCLRTSPGILES